MSKMENAAYEELRGNKLFVFKIKDMRLLLGIDRIQAYNLVKSMKNKSIIKNVGKAFFAFSDANEFSIGTTINVPSYISFWSALSYHGFSDQMPKKIFIATTRYSKSIGNFKYVAMSTNRFFGYMNIGDIVIADKEKAIIDSLLFSKYSGGIKEIIKCARAAINNIDAKKLVEYGMRMKSKAIIRRLGFVLEKAGYNGKATEFLQAKIGKGYELLDPSLCKKNNLNKKWLLDVNI